MIWFFGALSVLTTFVIAAVSIGGVTARLAQRPRASVYDLEEAVEWVAEDLPGEITAAVSYDDVRAVLSWYVEYLTAKGVATEATAAEIHGDVVVVPEDERLGWVLGRSDEVEAGAPGAELTDEQIAAILRSNRAYEQSIGAIGEQVTGSG